MEQTLKDIFRPTAAKLVLTMLLAGFVHYYLIADVLRQQAATGVQQVTQFWFTNYLDALPYLESESTVVKFLIFFIGSYLLVWAVSTVMTVLENLERLAIKRLRRTA